ncbi:MAG TPA: glycosyl hydrolase, partial [Armatimonadota bacterium]|nr:glycosyl hydrolase [Armatimonadota bacterium]
YDHYGYSFDENRYTRLFQEINKPVLLGEFSYPTWHNGLRGYGQYGVFASDDADAGNKYSTIMKSATANPYCVGMFWFMYRDQHATGRGPVNTASGVGEDAVYGEHYAFGMVDVADNPKWDLITRAREANLQADQWRNAK